jgi:hypothetical protein
MRPSTRTALLAYRAAQSPDRRTYVKLVADLDLLPADTGLLSDVINENHGHVSTLREDRLRLALGLPVGRTARATIQVHPKTRLALQRAKLGCESFDALIQRLLTIANALEFEP